LCRTAYSPELFFAQLDVIDSSYAFHVSPWLKMLDDDVVHEPVGLQSPSNGVRLPMARPEVAPT
jgi:hypothetical protein